MTAWPAVAEAAIAAVLVSIMARAFFGAPPPRVDLVAAAAWMLAGLILLGTVLLSGPGAWHREGLTAGSVVAVCVAGWWLRGREDPGEPEQVEPPPDWDEFDLLRETWRRGPREPTPAPW